MFTYFLYIVLSKFIRFSIHSIGTNNRMNFIINFNRKREDFANALEIIVPNLEKYYY